MADQTFKVAGITTHNGNSKVRFTDDLIRRVKQFSKGGATRIDLMELPTAMSKIEALKYLQAHADFQSPDDQALISDCIADREKGLKKGEVKVMATKGSKTVKPSLDAIKARGKEATTA
jgi:hypothetical protein